MRRYKYRKTYVWDTELAYLIGLIAADGCLINNNRHINVTSKDIETIQSVQSILQSNVKVSIKRGGFGTDAYHLTFSNVALYDFLLETGLTPAKSLNIGPLLIPDSLYADFLRGYFDGDGSVYGSWDKRWRSSLMYYTAFTSASVPFLHWVQAANSRLAMTTKASIKPGVRACYLTYAKADSRKLFRFMYYAGNTVSLSRKYDKFVAFLGADPYANKDPARVLESVDRPA